MLKKERLVKIAHKVNQNGIITIQEIMDELGVSDMTARRDLDEIEKSCPTIDGMMEGTVSFGEGSTIIDCTQEEIKILRAGPITIQQIKEVIDNKSLIN